MFYSSQKDIQKKEQHRSLSSIFTVMLPSPTIFSDHPPETWTNLLTLALNLATKSKCFFRSVAKIASMTRKRKCLNSTWSRLTRKLYSGLDMKRFQAAAAWWFSRTERSLYSTACESNAGSWELRNLLVKETLQCRNENVGMMREGGLGLVDLFGVFFFKELLEVEDVILAGLIADTWIVVMVKIYWKTDLKNLGLSCSRVFSSWLNCIIWL